MLIGTSPLHDQDVRQAGPSPRAEPTLLSPAVLDELRDLVGATGFDAFLAQVLTDLCAAAEGIARAGEAGDFASLRRHSHTMIGIAGAIGAVEVEEGARVLNASARDADAQAARAHAAALCCLSDALCGEIRAQRKGQPSL